MFGNYANDSIIDVQLLTSDLHDVSFIQLPPSSRIDFAIHFHFARLNQQLRLSAGIRHAASLQEVIEAERFAGGVFVIIVHKRGSQRA